MFIDHVVMHPERTQIVGGKSFNDYIMLPTESIEDVPLFGMYQYVFAGNGIFIRAKREGLEAMIPYVWCEIPGLVQAQPYVRLQAKVPEFLLRKALLWSVEALPNEALFWFGRDSVSGIPWKIRMPKQLRSRASVRPVDPYDEFGAQAVIDLHSHNTMRAFFSRTDDRDETGFRIYAVVGAINVRSQQPPEIHVRVGIFGHFWPVPAADVFVMPPFLRDAGFQVETDMEEEEYEEETSRG